MIIKKITKKTNKIPKKYYDIEVENYHNFFITKSKVVTHNSSLESTIIGMAQNFVGSNNINLLEPNGEYGTRLKGGKDASASRYIFTKLSEITREIFKIEDDEVLDYLMDDGYKIEPNFYAPIIPMVLVNGSDGIGTGWSSYIPHFNPEHLIDYIKAKLQNKKLPELHPWFKNFKGDTLYDPEKNRYISRGKYKKLPKNILNITELPISMWNDKYYTILDKLIEERFIRDYDKHCTDNSVNIIISLPQETYNTLTDDIILKKFNLETYINMNNMNLFDENGKIYSYKDQYEIIDNFIKLRLEYYKLRKQNILNKLNEREKYIINKMKFINCVLKKKIIFENKSKDDIIKQIESEKIEKYNDNYDYLINIPLIGLSKERLDNLQDEFNKVKDEIEITKALTEDKMWIKELNNLKRKLSN
jgi:DNA topoisomerase-2